MWIPLHRVFILLLRFCWILSFTLWTRCILANHVYLMFDNNWYFLWIQNLIFLLPTRLIYKQKCYHFLFKKIRYFGRCFWPILDNVEKYLNIHNYYVVYTHKLLPFRFIISLVETILIDRSQTVVSKFLNWFKITLNRV